MRDPAHELAAKVVQEQRNRALVHAARMRQQRVRPEATWRCHRGELLIAAYSTPLGIIWYAPTSRISPSLARKSTSRHLIQADSAETSGGALVTKERAGILADLGIPIVCKHIPFAAAVPASEVRARVAAALASDTPEDTLLPPPDAHR